MSINNEALELFDKEVQDILIPTHLSRRKAIRSFVKSGAAGLVAAGGIVLLASAPEKNNSAVYFVEHRGPAAVITAAGMLATWLFYDKGLRQLDDFTEGVVLGVLKQYQVEQDIEAERIANLPAPFDQDNPTPQETSSPVL